MSPEQKALLTAAFEALGPERVTRGLKATGRSWMDCFLAIATYGEPGAFVREVKNRRRRTDANDFASSLIGVPLGVVDEVVGLWDHEERGRWPPSGWNSTARPCRRHRPSPRHQHQVRGNRRLGPARGEEAVRAWVRSARRGSQRLGDEDAASSAAAG